VTVKELMSLLREVDPDRIVYVQDIDGTSQPAQRVVRAKHFHLPAGIVITDDIAIMTTNTFMQLESIEE